MSLLQTIEHAYRAVLAGASDSDQVKLALMHTNLIHSEPTIRTFLQDWSSLDGCQNALHLDETTRKEALSAAHRFTRQSTTPDRHPTLFRLQPFKRNGRLSGMIWDQIARILDPAVTPGDGVRSLAVGGGQLPALWREHHPNDAEDHWLWLSDSPADEADIEGHLLRLGLLPWATVKADDAILLWQWQQPKAVAPRKPNWLHNGLAYYFDSAPDHAGHGCTRCLATGEEGCREWVALVKEIGSPSHCKILIPRRTIDLSEPRNGFWAKSIERIKACRGDVHAT